MDLDKIWDTTTDVLGNSLVQVALTIIVVLTLQLIARHTIGRIVQRAVRSHHYQDKVDERKREQTLVKIFRTASAVVLWSVAIIVILLQLNINVAALMTGAGLLGIVVGFGAQSAIKDFLAGIFVILENQYRVGDIVTLDVGGMPVTGIVEDITIRITRLRDLDGNLHIVSNGSVGTISNLSFKFANVNVDVGVSYAADIDKVEKVVNEVGDALAKDKIWGEHIIEPIQFLRVEAFDDSSVRIKALGKVEAAQQWDIAGVFRRRLKKAFETNGIEIPLPQIVVNKSAR